MDYKVTKKAIYCDYRCSARTVIRCLGCGKYVFDKEQVVILNEQQFVEELNRGNCVITKVELL